MAAAWDSLEEPYLAKDSPEATCQVEDSPEAAEDSLGAAYLAACRAIAYLAGQAFLFTFACQVDTAMVAYFF